MWLDGKPLNYDPQNAPSSQDLPEIMALNFGVIVIGRSTIIEESNVVGK